MYITDQKERDILEKFNVNISLEKIKYDDVLLLLSDSDVEILSAYPSSNSYGEFYFIDIRIKSINECYTLYGLGFHEYREKWFVDDFNIFSSSCSHSKTGICNKQRVITEILELKLEILGYEDYQERLKSEPSHESVMFNIVADLADDDYAISAMDEGLFDGF